jgi:hypothetical protein
MDSATRSTPLARWMSFATCGTMLATPGWNIPVARPLANCRATIAPNDGVPRTNSTAIAEWITSRARTARTIIRRAVNLSASTRQTTCTGPRPFVEGASPLRRDASSGERAVRPDLVPALNPPSVLNCKSPANRQHLTSCWLSRSYGGQAAPRDGVPQAARRPTRTSRRLCSIRYARWPRQPY